MAARFSAELRLRRAKRGAPQLVAARSRRGLVDASTARRYSFLRRLCVVREMCGSAGDARGSVRVSVWGARYPSSARYPLVGSPNDAVSRRLAGELRREEAERRTGRCGEASGESEGQARVGTDSRRRRCRRRRAFRRSAGIPATRAHLLGFDAAKVDKLPLLNASHRLATLSHFAQTHQHPRSHGLPPSAAPSGWTARTTSPSSTARRRRRPRPSTKTHPRVVASRCSTRAGSPSRRRGACTSPTPATTASASSTATACACSPGRARAATPTARASRRRSRTRAGWCSTRTACSSWPTAATTASGGSRRRAW